jgi:A/G-specific adenine glycosylase
MDTDNLTVLDDDIRLFSEAVWGYYNDHGRHNLPWRTVESDGTMDPYKIMVSEIMLQQTQVGRVIPKYAAFLGRFPDIKILADAELGEVLRFWQGLGYNRRAKFLWQSAGQIAASRAFPRSQEALVKLPGIGMNTAGAIRAYAYNEPALFIETNVRTVYIHHFLADEADVPDKTITQLLAQSIDREHPREFYWALMDYGTYLKATVGNFNKASKHYAKQSTFSGSRRQVRGLVLRLLSERPHTLQELQTEVSDERLDDVLADLSAEGLIHDRGGMYAL